MAIDSPRISFSYDLPRSGDAATAVLPVEECVRTSSFSSSSSGDFDFCVVHESSDLESSSADELFSDGKILPVQIKRRILPASIRSEGAPLRRPPSVAAMVLPRSHPPPQKTTKPPVIVNEMKIPEFEEKRKLSSFWRFKRSSSLNCGSSSSSGGTLCPLPLLYRSSSTGSPAIGKHSPSIAKQGGFLRSNSWNSWQKQPHSTAWPPPRLKRNNSQGYSSRSSSSNNRMKLMNPVVLNVPPANLFGLASIFSMGKGRRSKKNKC